MAKCKPINTPIDSGLLISIMPSFSDSRAPIETVLWYLSAVDYLIYVMTMTRPDIVFA